MMLGGDSTSRDAYERVISGGLLLVVEIIVFAFPTGFNRADHWCWHAGLRELRAARCDTAQKGTERKSRRLFYIIGSVSEFCTRFADGSVMAGGSSFAM